MPEDQELQISAEEKAAEEQGLATVEADEIKGKLATDFGIDPEKDSELLDKLVERETENRERLSKTIKQKINWRDKAKGSKKPVVEKPKDGNKPVETPDVQELVDKGINDALESRDLKSLNFSEEIEEKVKKLAKLEGISIREAAKDPYIQSRVEEEQRAERISKASPKRTNKGTYTTSIDPSKPLDPDDFDLNSKEGIEAWKEAKKLSAKHRRENK